MSAWIDFIQNPRLAAVWLDALLKSFVVLAFAGGLCLVWRQAAAATRHLIWFVGIAGLLFLPLVPFVLPTTHRPLWSVSGGLTSGNQVALSLEFASTKSDAAINDPLLAKKAPTQPGPENTGQVLKAHVSRNGLSIGFGVWAFGMLLTLLYPVLGRIQLRRMAKNARVLDVPEWTRLLAEASETLGFHRRVVLLQSRESVMPLTWGWLRPKVLMPAEAEQWPVERRRIVLLHELAHVKRQDCLTQSITRIVCALYWFNPLAWIAARQMRVERERACDDLVLNGGCKASEYAGHLVQIATTFRHAPQAAGIAMARRSNLEQRVTAIVDASRSRELRPAGLVAIMVSIAAVIFYIGGYKTSAADEDKPTAVNQETLTQIEKFSAEKEAQSKMLAAAAGEKILPQFQKYFDAAKKGDFRTVTNMYADFKEHHPQYSKNPRWGYRTSYWQPMLEISLVYDQFAMGDSKYTQMAANDIINSIPPGSIYFGGTDPGRGLPTAFSKSHMDADPFYTISQNPLADTSYDQYLRNTYGEQRRTLAQLVAARQADPELSALDKQFQAAEQKALSLEMSKPDNDPARQAADKAMEDLNSKIDAALIRVKKSVEADENSAKTNSWTEDKVIYVPTTNDVQKGFTDYMENAQRRLLHDQTFPAEPKQVKPGEDIKVEGNGHVQVSGQVAVQGVNAQISKMIFDKNPNREFYVEESFPHDWMYPHLEPNGLIMKINREPLAELPDNVVQKDQDYWQSRVNAWLGNWLTEETPVQTVADFAEKTYGRKDLGGFTGDPSFIRDNYAPKMFSKWRSSIADVYAWRLGFGVAELPPEYAPKNDAEKQKLMQAADFAFKQAFAICPFSPEAVFSYVNFLTKAGRKTDALAVVHAAAIVDPKNEMFRYLERDLPAQFKSSTNSPTEKSVKSPETLQQLKTDSADLEAQYKRGKALDEKLKAMGRQARINAIQIMAPDTQLNELLSELTVAEQQLIQLETKYKPEHPACQRAEAAVNDLQHKIDDRVEALMREMETKLDASAALKADIDEIIEKKQSAQ